MQNILALLYFMLPAYFANMMPVVAKCILPGLSYPLDFRMKLKGKRILGSHKTWRGLISGVIAAIIIALIQYKINFAQWNLIGYSNWLLIGFLMGFGALLGDAAASFVKRRIGIKLGKPFYVIDQTNHVIGATLLISPIYFVGWIELTALLIITGALHVIINLIAYKLKLRETKW